MRLAQEGAHVVVADLNEETAKTAAREIMSGADRKALAIRVDVTDEAQVAGMVARTVQEFGRLDVVVSNAGILIAEEVAEFPADTWRAVINVNLFGYFLVA
jgi:NAD(P)-dependent dehydrogenase (short-subunit alcohol dehydrogenase family)